MATMIATNAGLVSNARTCLYGMADCTPRISPINGEKVQRGIDQG